MLGYNVVPQVTDKSEWFAITPTLHINVKKSLEKGDELSLKQLISSFPYECCHRFSDKDEINEYGACQWFQWLPKRCSWLQLVKAFVCHRNVNTCEPLAGENTFELNCGLHWLQACRCCRFCQRKTSHEEGSSDFQLSGETAAACSWHCWLWLYWLWCKASSNVKAWICCLWREHRHSFYAQFNGFWDGTLNKGGSQVLILCALVEKDKNLLVKLSYGGRERKREKDYGLWF